MARPALEPEVVAGSMRFRRQEHQRAPERVQAKQQVIADLIGGRLRLLEASARFQALDGLARAGERVVRTVIGWASLALRDRPEQAAALTEQLERELRTHLARHGSLHLPTA